MATLIIGDTHYSTKREIAEHVEELRNEIENLQMQLVGCSVAALGYFKEGDTLKLEYKSVALDDVTRLYKDYEELLSATHTSWLTRWWVIWLSQLKSQLRRKNDRYRVS